MSLNNSTLQISLTAGETNSFGAVSQSINFNHQPGGGNYQLTDGTGNNNAKRSQEVTGDATGGVTIDLTAVAGGLDGATRDWSSGTAKIRILIFENTGAAAITLTQSTNGWTGFSGAATGLSKAIDPGGVVVIYAPTTGLTVTGTNKAFVATGASTYKMSIVGVCN